MNKAYIDKYIWMAVSAVTEDHGEHPYARTVLTYFNKQFCSTVFEGELVYHYVKIINEESKKTVGICSPKAVELAINAKFWKDDPQDKFFKETLLERNKSHQKFSNQVRNGKHKSLLTTLRENIIKIVREGMVSFYAKQMDNATIEKRISLAKNILMVEKMTLPEEKITVFGNSSPKSTTNRLLRPTYVDWIDKNIRFGKGLALTEQLLIHIRSNGGKGVLSSQIAYLSAKNGINTVLMYNEDNEEKVKYHILSKIWNIDPLEISQMSDEKVSEGYKQINESLKGKLVLRRLSGKELNIENLGNIIPDMIHEHDLNNPRIVFDYLSNLTSSGNLSSESWKIDLDAYKMFEFIMEEFHGDMVAFDQINPKYNEERIIKSEYIAGAKAKTQKARHIIGIGATDDDLKRKIRFANISKVTGGGEYGKVNLQFNPNSFTLDEIKK